MAKYDYLNAKEWEKAIDAFYQPNANDLTNEEFTNVQKKFFEVIETNFIKNTVKTTAVSVLSDTLGLKRASTEQLVNATRNDMAQQLRKDIDETLDFLEEDLVIINYNLVCSPLCRGAQNKVYSRSGRTKGYPLLEDFEFSTNSWKNGHALFHPWCKHWLSVYFPGESDPPFSPEPSEEEQEEFYNKTEELKAQRSRKNKYYQRKAKADAMGDKTYSNEMNKRLDK